MADRIVVDGSNVAWEQPTKDGGPRVANIVAVDRALRERGYRPLIIIDASLRHQVDDPDQLEGLIDGGRLDQAPAGTEADYFVLLTARQHDAPIVSNDMFEDWADEFEDERRRRVPYMLVGERVQLHEPSLREHGDED